LAKPIRSRDSSRVLEKIKTRSERQRAQRMENDRHSFGHLIPRTSATSVNSSSAIL
jgi:hypothetical protein